MAVNVRALGSLEVHNGRGEELRVLHAHPKRLALFIYMALSGPGGTLHPREKLCAMFWPDAPEDRARLSLRQALHFLRRAAGSEIIASRLGDEIGTLPPGATADVSVLADERGRWKLRDNEGTEVAGERLLRPLFCLRAGRRFDADAPILPTAQAA